MQIAVERHGVAAMGDHVEAVDVRFVEAMRHAVTRRKWREGARVHQLRGLRLKDLLTVVLAVLEMGDHELAHVFASRG